MIASDNAYSIPLAVCLYSMLEKTNEFLDIYILNDCITEENIEKIRKSIIKFKNHDLTFIDMNQYNLSAFPVIERYTSSCFSRYFIPQICKQYDKVIYTDADVIFTDDIEKYYTIDLNGYGLAAVPEELGEDEQGIYSFKERKKKFGLQTAHKYFANGNIIINCKYWREKNITNILLNKTFELKNMLVCPDLDVMNIVFENNYKLLDYKYCCCVHRYDKTNGNSEMINAFKNPFIIHFSGHLKPWQTSDIIFAKEFAKILKKTKYQKTYKKLYGTFANNIFSLYADKSSARYVITILGIKFKIKNEMFKKIFSVQNKEVNNRFYKIICTLGIKLKIRNKRKEFEHRLFTEIQFLKQQLEESQTRIRNVEKFSINSNKTKNI